MEKGVGGLEAGRGKTDEVEDGKSFCHGAAVGGSQQRLCGRSRKNARNTVESTQLSDTERGDDYTQTVLDSGVAIDGIGTSELVGCSG